MHDVKVSRFFRPPAIGLDFRPSDAHLGNVGACWQHSTLELHTWLLNLFATIRIDYFSAEIGAPAPVPCWHPAQPKIVPVCEENRVCFALL